MMRWRFSSGLLLGLVAGGAAGTLIGVLLAPPRGSDASQATALQVQELSRKLTEAQEARLRADQQLERFAQLAEQMTVSFNKLDERFKKLSEQAAALEAETPPTAGQGDPAPSPQPPVAGTPADLNDSPS